MGKQISENGGKNTYRTNVITYSIITFFVAFMLCLGTASAAGNLNTSNVSVAGGYRVAQASAAGFNVVSTTSNMGTEVGWAGAGGYGAFPALIASASVSPPYYIGTGLEETCSPYTLVQVFGAPLGTPNANNWPCLAEITGATTSFNLSTITPDHEVAVSLYTLQDFNYGTTITFQWYNPQNQLMYNGAINIPSPSSEGYPYWSWYYVYGYIGYLNNGQVNQQGLPEIEADGNYYVVITNSATGQSQTIPFTVTGIPLTVGITPASPTVSSGQTEVLTANPSGGSGIYSYQWYAGGSCSGTVVGTQSTYTTPALTSTTTYCIRLTDSLGNGATATDTVTVNSLLTLSVNPSPYIIGSEATFTVSGTGFPADTAITLKINPTLGGSGTLAAQQTTTSTGTFTTSWPGGSNGWLMGTLNSASPGTVTITASGGGASASKSFTLAAATQLIVSVSPASQSVDAGQTITLTAIPTGGGGTYSYQWYSNSACTTAINGATSSTYTTPALISTTTYCVRATDSLGDMATATDTVTVVALPTISISPASQNVIVGQTITITATVGNPGSGGDTYQWYNSSTPINGQTGLIYTATAISSGATFSYHTVVTDSRGSTGTSNIATVTVSQPGFSLNACETSLANQIESIDPTSLPDAPSAASGLASSCALSGTGVDSTINSTLQNFVLTLANKYIGGAGGYVAGETVSGTVVGGVESGITSVPGIFVICVYGAAAGPGDIAICGTATIAAGGSATLSGAVTGGYTSYLAAAEGVEGISGFAPFAAYIPYFTASPTIDSGQTATLSVAELGASGTYTYQWYLGSSCSGTVLGTSATYTTPELNSTTIYCAKVINSQSIKSTTTMMVIVNPPLTVSITPSNSTVNLGESETLMANPIGGSGPTTTDYSFQWYSGSSCSGNILASSGLYSLFLANMYSTPALSSTTTYCVKVVDPLGTIATARTTVTVKPSQS